MDNPEDTGEFLEDTRRWTLSQAEGRDIPNPPDVQGVCPTGEAIAAAVADENYARYRASSSIKQKGYNKGKHAGHVTGNSSKGKKSSDKTSNKGKNKQGGKTDFPELWVRGNPGYDAFYGIGKSDSRWSDSWGGYWWNRDQ